MGCDGGVGKIKRDQNQGKSRDMREQKMKRCLEVFKKLSTRKVENMSYVYQKNTKQVILKAQRAEHFLKGTVKVENMSYYNRKEKEGLESWEDGRRKEYISGWLIVKNKRGVARNM